MDSLKLKHKISTMIDPSAWYSNNLDKEGRRCAENIHSEEWNKNIESMEKSIRKYGTLWKGLKYV